VVTDPVRPIAQVPAELATVRETDGIAIPVRVVCQHLDGLVNQADPDPTPHAEGAPAHRECGEIDGLATLFLFRRIRIGLMSDLGGTRLRCTGLDGDDPLALDPQEADIDAPCPQQRRIPR
jgi:hypothetical protein